MDLVLKQLNTNKIGDYELIFNYISNYENNKIDEEKDEIAKYVAY